MSSTQYSEWQIHGGKEETEINPAWYKMQGRLFKL